MWLDPRRLLVILSIGFSLHLHVINGEDGKQNEKKTTEFLDNFLVDYDKRIRPDFASKAVLVNISMQVASIGHIAESTMDYRVTVFLRQLWNDPRLKFYQFDHPVNVDVSLLDQIWVPDLFVVNEKSANFHTVTKDNKLLRISPNGDVIVSQRVSLTLSCNMRLHRFPMDHQICKIQLESYAFTTKDIDFDWTQGPVPALTIEESVELPQFFIQKYWTNLCTRTYSTGEYPCVEALIRLQRQTGYYLIQTYVPTLLIVCLSWISFWIDASASTARVALGITTVLTMTTQTSAAQESLPKVSYVKAIDIWMAVCLLFVFSALLEFSAVNYMARYIENRRQRKRNRPAKKSRKNKKKKSSVQMKETDLQSIPSQLTITAYSPDLHAIKMSRFQSCKETPIISKPGSHDSSSENIALDFTNGDALFKSAGGNAACAYCRGNISSRNVLNKSAQIEESESTLSLRIDEMSRVVFPFAFAIFNCFYWVLFMRHQD